MKNIVTNLQPIGRALMLPIAVLPAAALLLRLGQPDLLNIAAVAAAGNAIFSNLGLLFAIGVAVGLARENHGAAGLASVVGFLVTTKGAEVLIGVPSEVTADLSGRAVDLAAAAYRAKELAKLSVPAGLINGLLAGWLYNRYSNVRLPSYLAFFAGRRFVPIASGFAGILLALCFGYGFPMLERGMDAASHAVLASDAFGQFIYGVLNRVLIVTGLHHILNNIAWFLLGEYNGVTGDLNRFFAGDPTAGAFMSGFFPVMMFGLPAACLAMYRSALPEKRNAVAGLLLSMALTSFLTGVTEPIEFSFMFLAPVLYAVHAVLTGAAMALMAALDVRLGFGFSAGLFDYVLNFKQATRPLLLVPIGLVYFGVYYGLFRFFIVRLDLMTPGREVEEAGQGAAQAGEGASGAAAWVHALGGARNLVSVDACTTRLRLIVADQATVNEGALKRLGARGVVRPSAEAL
ncbi:MAG TPA: N-acetylglucosamine-specific PTS transporter subunit IIBC, partial [Steroidobacteraceae bacterium]|nr:N-acetylglucosamine-specific PTS transporter subunit IIBC [Steroidobacteraceae bacterium]